MKLDWIAVEGFRNLGPQTIGLAEQTTLLYGPNAQGKTNVLEAIYLLGTTRSFRENQLAHLIQEGAGEALARGAISDGGVQHELAVALSAGERRQWRDGAEAPLQLYLETMPVVVLSAEDRSLAGGVPRYRRDFLDGTSVWRRPAYLETLMAFGRSRRQRAHVLRGYGPAMAGELEAWTAPYRRWGGAIQEERAAMTALVNGVLAELGDELDVKERVRLVYEPSGGGDLGAALEGARRDELRRGVCLVGPQRDGVEILLNDRPLRSYGSSGQVRTALWLLKLSRVRLVAERDRRAPLFLLDDVEMELDETRIAQLMRMTQGKAQLVMTATRPLAPPWGPCRRYRVEAGRVMEEEKN